MQGETINDCAYLHRLLSEALALADSLDLSIAAIHIEQALDQVASQTDTI